MDQGNQSFPPEVHYFLVSGPKVSDSPQTPVSPNSRKEIITIVSHTELWKRSNGTNVQNNGSKSAGGFKLPEFGWVV